MSEKFNVVLYVLRESMVASDLWQGLLGESDMEKDEPMSFYIEINSGFESDATMDDWNQEMFTTRRPLNAFDDIDSLSNSTRFEV